jgi:two-component system, response regulator YesN
MGAQTPLTTQGVWRVMLVEDEAIVRNDMKGIIRWEDHGYRLVAEAENGLEALRILEEQKIDIVISDIEMPGMSGLELAARVLARFTSVKFIFLTAYSDFEFARASMRLGIDSYILKHEMSPQMLLGELDRMREELGKIGYQKTACVNDAMHSLLCMPQTEGTCKKILQDNGIEFNAGCSFLALIDMEEETSEEVRSFASAAIGRVVYGEDIASRTVFAMPETGIGVLITMRRDAVTDDPLQLPVLKCVNAIQEQLQSVFGRPFFICVSRMIGDESELYSVYQAISDAGNQRYFYQTPRVFFCEPPKRGPDTLTGEVASLCDKLQQQLLREAQDELVTLLTRDIQATRDMDVLKKALVPITSLIADVWNTEHEGTATVSPIALYQELMNLPNIYKTCDKICDMLEQVRSLQTEKHQKRIAIIHEYVAKNYAEDISLDQLGNLIGVSGAYMSQLFKQQTGVSFKTYLMNIRMKKAEELLRAGDRKISDVGENVGYSSTPYFCLMFKQHFGMTPREFTRKYHGR